MLFSGEGSRGLVMDNQKGKVTKKKESGRDKEEGSAQKAITKSTMLSKETRKPHFRKRK